MGRGRRVRGDVFTVLFSVTIVFKHVEARVRFIPRGFGLMIAAVR